MADAKLSPQSVEPIAIIGMGCRWPGEQGSPSDVETPNALWDYLVERKNSYSDFPADRMNLESWYHPESGRPGSFYTRGGCFLKGDPRRFDPTFFGINPQEATSLDPAQRKLLEVVYETLESSGATLETLSGSKTGVFVGNFNYDHQLMQYRDTEYPEPYGISGGGIALLSNRINYVFNLHGPSLTLDTACSSSMYALHLACVSILSGECTAAIVGGSNLILTPECQVFSASLGAVSKSSRCQTFDAAADGYARADGIGALYIKPLKQAIADNDPVRAIIRGTAINANGRTGGITHPDPDGQEGAIRRAYERAGNLDPNETFYFECHGTGTPVGDPLEVEAIGRFFAKGRPLERPLNIGSIKSNMGHCEPASGIAGIMKTVLALEHGVVPPILGLNKLNPNIDLHHGKLKIVEGMTGWPAGELRRASVNSFGYGGANAHTILESIDQLAPGHGGVQARSGKKATDSIKGSNGHTNGLNGTGGVNGSNGNSINGNGMNGIKKIAKVNRMDGHTLPRRSQFLLPFSAHNESTLKQNMAAIRDVAGNYDILDLAYTLGCRRSTLASRACVIASQDNVVAAMDIDSLAISKAMGSRNLKLGFVFTGQGAQWAQMGLDLMDSFPTYLQSIRKMDRALQSLSEAPDWTIENVLREPEESSMVQQASMSQPLVTAIQVALVDLLSSWNIRPVVSIGHSSGEIGATYASGLLSAAEAIVVAYARGRAVSRNTSKGAMMAVGAGPELVGKTLEGLDSLTIACYNSPESVTISGNAQDVAILKQRLDIQSIFARVLHTDGNAYHSAHMKSIGARYEDEVADMLSQLSWADRDPGKDRTEFVSTVYGDVTKKTPNAQYWRRNLESPVRFSQGLSKLADTVSIDYLIEMGPHSALQGPIRQVGQASEASKPLAYLPTLLRNKDGVASVLSTAGTLFANGHDVDLLRVNAIEHYDGDSNTVHGSTVGKTIVDLPKYQWQYDRLFFFENRWTREFRLRTHARHDLLGSRMPGGNRNEPVWRNVLKGKNVPWLRDHQIGSNTVFPTTGYLAMAVEATLQAAEIHAADTALIRSFGFQDVVLPAALIVPEGDQDLPEALSPGPVSAQKPVSSARWYDSFSGSGLNYGPAFQGLSRIQILGGESRYLIHPAALDSALQLAIIAYHRGRTSDCTSAFLPVSVGSLTIHVTPDSTTSSSPPFRKAKAKTTRWDERGFASSATIYAADTEDCAPIVQATNIAFLASQAELAPREAGEKAPFTRMDWSPDFDLLTTSKVERMYPHSGSYEMPEVPMLEQLALHQIVQFHEQYHEFFVEGSHVPFLQRYLDWMAEKVNLAKEGKLPGGKDVVARSQRERDAEMQRLTAALMEHHAPETRLMVHMYQSLPAVYRGEMTGIQAAVQDHLLDDTYEFMELYSAGNKALTEMIKLLSYKNPRLKILEVGGGTGSATKEVVPALRGDSLYRGYESYTFTDITSSFLAKAHDNFKQYGGMKYATFDMQTPASEQGFEADYDLVIASNVIHATTDIQKTLSNVRSLLKPGGHLALFEIVQPRLSWVMILGTFSDFWNGDQDGNFRRTEGPFLTHAMWNSVLPQSGFRGVDIKLDSFAEYKEAAVIFARTIEYRTPRALPASEEVALVYRNEPSDFVVEFAQFLSDRQYSVELLPLVAPDGLQNKRAIFLAEIDQPLFTNISNEEWTCVKKKILTASSSLWVTRGSLAAGKHPEYALITGLVSALRTESKSLKFLTADIEVDATTPLLETFEDLMKLERLAETHAPDRDTEFRAKGGLMHVTRLTIDEELNDAAAQRVEKRSGAPELRPVEALQKVEFRLSLEKPRAPETAYFEEVQPLVERLEADSCEIRVQSVRLGQMLRESILVGDSRHPKGGEFYGTIQRVGAAVASFKPGEAVFGITFGHIGNVIRVKDALLHKLPSSDSLAEVATASLATYLAAYSLCVLGRVSKGDSVLISSNATDFMYAAYQIAKHKGAQTTIIYTTQANARMLSDLGIQPAQIVSSASELLKLTSGSAFDVVVAESSEGISEELIAPLGHFIQLGDKSALEIGRRQNMTVTSVDLESVVHTKPSIIAALTSEIQAMNQQGALKAYPTKVFGAGDLQSAFLGLREAAVATPVIDLGLQETQAMVPSRHLVTPISFDPHASYLLIGCLGGLGRSFTKWMVERGARQFVFLSRSGAPSQEAQKFISWLESVGAEATVVKGDVASRQDVDRAVGASPGVIKGVIQAPLELNDALFDAMTLDDFNKTMRPRVIGTINLHEALLQAPLDFFVMWSSWTTILGSLSQGNYMASNSFMDEFARHRLSLGLPATSLSLGHMLDVGIVSYNLQYQEHLNRMGLYGNSEDEFLQYCEAAIAESSAGIPAFTADASLSRGHLLGGLEPRGLLANNQRYPVEEMGWYSDPRFSHLVSAFHRLESAATDGPGGDAIVVADDDETGTLEDRVHKRVARLLFVSTDDIERRQPIKNYGIDSMVAAELRNWLFKATGVNITLLELLHPTMSVEALGRKVESELGEKRGSGNGA
ncbi:KR domain-containing protein [Apiospora rasikravindrae]|uniref:KR domain-containing protein n=1 Tax=Apiospora rasikravindrae TaxID=990691 RepID=A0ABR1S2Y7_9PEZI